MQRLKSLWRSSSVISPRQQVSTPQQQTSFIETASNYISYYRKQPLALSSSQFDEYLQSIPEEYAKFKKNNQQRKSRKSFQSVKPQLVKKVYENVQNIYFAQNFEIRQQFFQKNKKKNQQKQFIIHQALDEVQVALFNQIVSRFDEILSVLRTVQSLDCLVQFNLQRIRTIRSHNIQVAKNTSFKQLQIVKSINKKKNIEASLLYLQKLKIYKKFLNSQKLTNSKVDSQPNTSQLYESIQDIKKQVSFLSNLKCCQKLYLQVQNSEQDLKKSFSESLNELIYDYSVGKISPYRRGFWEKFKHKTDILEEEQKNQLQGTVLLDQSTIVQEDISHLDRPKLILHEQTQQIILKYIKRGWNEGEYAVGSLKSMIEKQIKTIHTNFLDNFREFCQNYLKSKGKQVQNPCLQDLLQQFNLPFFTKCCTYYSTLFQNIAYRLGSITSKSLHYIIEVIIQYGEDKESPLTIEQKQKLSQVMDGIMNVMIFVCKSIFDKFREILQSKEIVETYDIAQFKAFIGIIQNLQDFFHQKVFSKIEELKFPESCFLSEKFLRIKDTVLLIQVVTLKKAKLLQYLSKIHKNAIEIQLKESLQNQIWAPTDIPTFYYDSLHYIITGESLNLRRNRGLRSTNASNMMGGSHQIYDTSVLMESMYKEQSYLIQKKPQISSNFRIIRTQILIDNQVFKITQTILLLLEIVEDYMLLNQFYPQISEEIAIKLSQIFRSYNASSLQLIVHAGAVVLGKLKTKSITAKHLALSTLCLRFCVFILQCIKKRISIKDQQKLEKDLEDHAQTTTKKLQIILKGKVTSSIPEIKLQSSPTKGTEAIVSSCKILHDILIDFFDEKTLKKIFVKDIFTQYIARISTIKVNNKGEAQSLKDDINFLFSELKFLSKLIQNFEQYRMQAQNIVRVVFEAF